MEERSADVKNCNMKKWLDEEYGDKYSCTYGCPVNQDGYGICPKVMLVLHPLMEAVRSGGDLRNVGGSGMYSKDIVCPDGCVMFRLAAKRLSGKNPFISEAFQ